MTHPSSWLGVYPQLSGYIVRHQTEHGTGATFQTVGSLTASNPSPAPAPTAEISVLLIMLHAGAIWHSYILQSIDDLQFYICIYDCADSDSGLTTPPQHSVKLIIFLVINIRKILQREGEFTHPSSLRLNGANICYESLLLMIDITWCLEAASKSFFVSNVIPPFLSWRSCGGSYSGDNLQSTSISYLKYVVRAV